MMIMMMIAKKIETVPNIPITIFSFMLTEI